MRHFAPGRTLVTGFAATVMVVFAPSAAAVTIVVDVEPTSVRYGATALENTAANVM